MMVHAWNMKVMRELVNAVHHWHAESNSAKENPGLDMADVSTMLTILFPTILCYSCLLQQAHFFHGQKQWLKPGWKRGGSDI
jgi:hypothetical protein